MSTDGDPDFAAQLLKAYTNKGLRRDVDLLLTSPDELHIHRALLDIVTYKVIVKIDVLAAIMKYLVLAEENRQFVLNEDECRGIVLVQHLAEKTSQPYPLTCCCSYRDVYTISHEEVVTTFYLTDCQLMRLLPRKNNT